LRTIEQAEATPGQDLDQRGGLNASDIGDFKGRTVQASLQRRVQRYGWDRAAPDYEKLWQEQLSVAQDELLLRAALTAGDRVLDVACGTGLVTFRAAQTVGSSGHVLGVDISGRMIDAAQQRAQERKLTNVTFSRTDAESLDIASGSFDVVLCSLGLMYLPNPELAVREMRRVLRPGGRVALAVWGERSACGWAPLFPIVDAEVSSEVCPLFFRLGRQDALTRSCSEAALVDAEAYRVSAVLDYADENQACDAAFVGGPVALAWSRFDETARTRVRQHYLQAIAAWRHGAGYKIPGEFVIVVATAP
jgi:ubiquinone/menaquinone biosynthesis C-methylase UbiE